MAIKWQQKPKEILLAWIRELDKPAYHSKLTPWEEHFVASISFLLAVGGPLSPRQQEILEKIYAEKTN